MSTSLLLQNGVHLGVDEGEPFEGRLVHGVDQVLVTVREVGFLAQELPVKVAAVAGGFLLAKRKSIVSLSKTKGGYSD